MFASALLTVRAADQAPLATVLQSAVDKHLVAGAVVLVADKERVLDVEAGGYASLSAKTPMKTDSLFWIASMFKSFTGAALTTKHWDAFFEFYMDTGSRKWGRPYLTRAFFTELSAGMAERVLLVLAKRSGRYIAGDVAA